MQSDKLLSRHLLGNDKLVRATDDCWHGRQVAGKRAGRVQRDNTPSTIYETPFSAIPATKLPSMNLGGMTTSLSSSTDHGEPLSNSTTM